MESRPIIALVGRPNVGKSTIFNRLIGRRQAITSDIPGTTRDRHFGVVQWFQNSWTVVDTAGILFGEEEDELANKALQQAMEEQVAVAVEEATLVAVVVDVKQGISHDDRRLIDAFRKHNKPLVILANKADNANFRLQAESFRELGIEPIIPISAVHGSGVGDFIDYLIKHYPSPIEEAKDRIKRVTFIGRPNVGKSTLVNRILGEKRMVVSNTPGTTRDSIEVDARIDENTPFKLVDTAGIRRRGKIEEGIEKFSLFRTLRAINWSDIVVVLLTIEEAPTRGDAHVVMYALEANKEVVLLLNKTDLAQEDIFKLPANKKRVVGEKFLKRFPFMQRLPFYFVSAQTGQGLDDFFEVLKEKIKDPPRTNVRGFLG